MLILENAHPCSNQIVMAAEVHTLKNHFPIFSRHPELIYLDSASTSQKPTQVIQAMSEFYSNDNANVHRGLYQLSSDATKKYESVRARVANFIGAKSASTIAFTKGTTESINIVARGYLEEHLRSEDNVVITVMEHHANLIPWQQTCIKKKAELRVLSIDENGDLNPGEITKLIDKHTRMVAVTHISNAIGTINPIESIVAVAKRFGAPVLLDVAQSISYYPIDVQKLGVDFLAFSAHKMFGPMGIGVLYANEQLAEQITPLSYGGGAIKSVKLDETRFANFPTSVEAGTPNVEGVVGMGEAISFIEDMNIKRFTPHMEHLASLLAEQLSKEREFTVVGDPKKRSGIVSFYHKSIHPHDIASFLGSKNIAVRAGHHCTQPLLDALKIPATVRASFSIYNSEEDVNKLMEALKDVKKFWS